MNRILVFSASLFGPRDCDFFISCACHLCGDGIQPAMVARDEVYMPPNAVAAYGGGSLKVGEKKLYKLMEQAHASRKKNGRGQSTGLQQLVG